MNTPAPKTEQQTLPEPLIVGATVLSEPLLGQHSSKQEQEAVTVDGEDEEFPNDHLSWTRGEKQPSTCRDGFWVILFLGQFVAIAALAIVWGIPAATSGGWPTDDENHLYYSDFAFLILWTALGASAISSLAMLVMTHYADLLIQISICFNIAASLVFSVLCLVQLNVGGAMVGLLFFTVGLCYARAVWPLIPWAASNLVTAVAAIQTNIGITLVGFGMVVLTLGFTLLWVLAFAGAYMHTTVCSGAEDGQQQCESHINGIVVALFLLAFYWTMQVIKNVLHVTVAGVVGTWWFSPSDARSCCSPSVRDSFVRATSTSFGSICLGSLLVAMVQVLNHLVRQARRHGRGNGVLLCIIECLVSVLQSLIEYFNKWAFVYVGLYGYSYVEAGPKVMELFRMRGWGAILNDQLVYRVLSWMSFIMGALSGLVGVLVVVVHPSLLRGVDAKDATWVAFGVGLIVGTILSNILLSILGSAVDTVVVCFAEAPAEFRHSYPEFSERMEEAWCNAFPTEFQVIANSTLV
eukprot:CAMPEP_0119013882 /NCGR_PEP_ID=MMETSP1176-20130426/9166_1 /TAXON_ID=265551 /ORGANISM="Synedropsis recta cf, Strain CCMP1620" /LENGTH=520 /DNA_ID=CAMNT_0006967009 /DNA_START=43 /DNA_END=1605 /DNA_ORIENTATION=+